MPAYTLKPRAPPKGFNRRQYLQRVDDIEVHEADATRTIGSELLFGRPAVNKAPIVEHHVIYAVGHDRPSVTYFVNVCVVDGKDAARDLIGRAFGNSAIAIDRTGIEQRRNESPARKTRAADEDTAAAHRSAFTAHRQADQFGGDDDTFVRLHIPQRERPLEDVDAEAVRPLAARTRIGGHDVEPLDIDMTAHDRFAHQDLHLTDRGDSGQPHSSQASDVRIVEDHTLVGRRRKTQPADFVVGGELQAVDAMGECNRAVIVLTEESQTRSEADGRCILQPAIHDDPAGTGIAASCDQIIDRGDATV